MTIKELIEFLETVPNETPVLIMGATDEYDPNLLIEVKRCTDINGVVYEKALVL